MRKRQIRNHMHLYFLAGSLCIAISTHTLPAQSPVPREEFYSFLNQYIQNLESANQMVDTTLSYETNLDLRVRQWNDYITGNLPRVLQVMVPLDKVSLKKERYNRAQMKISFDFEIKFPEDGFQFENNLPTGNFLVNANSQENAGRTWIQLLPQLTDLVIEANVARKLDVVETKGFLLFGIKMGNTRAEGWTQFYQTMISFNSLKWMVGEDLVWELEPLPFDQIMNR